MALRVDAVCRSGAGGQLTHGCEGQTVGVASRRRGMFRRTDRPKPMLKENPRWIEASDVIPMFPTLVWKIQLERRLHETIDAKILAALSELRRDRPPLAAGKGWQSVQTLHEREDFRDFVGCVQDAARGILRFLRISYDAVELSAIRPGSSGRRSRSSQLRTPTRSS